MTMEQLADERYSNGARPMREMFSEKENYATANRIIICKVHLCLHMQCAVGRVCASHRERNDATNDANFCLCLHVFANAFPCAHAISNTSETNELQSEKKTHTKRTEKSHARIVRQSTEERMRKLHTLKKCIEKRKRKKKSNEISVQLVETCSSLFILFFDSHSKPLDFWH